MGIKVSKRDTCECCDIEADKVLVGDYCYSGSDCGTNCKRCNTKGQACAICETAYFLTSDGQCNPCPTNCAVCTIAGGCTTCSNGFYFLNGRCVACTDDGQTKSGSDCVVCSVDNCKRCSSEGICIECRAGFWLESDDCCVECGPGKRQFTECQPLVDGDVYKCASCTVGNCLYCQEAVGTCTRCDSSNFLKSNTCDTCADAGEIQLTINSSGGDTCQICVTDCLECTR